MTLQEAQAVAAIIERADAGCERCVKDLTDLCAAQWPDYTWQVVDAWDVEGADWVGMRVIVTQAKPTREAVAV